MFKNAIFGQCQLFQRKIRNAVKKKSEEEEDGVLQTLEMLLYFTSYCRL